MHKVLQDQKICGPHAPFSICVKQVTTKKGSNSKANFITVYIYFIEKVDLKRELKSDKCKIKNVAKMYKKKK